MKYKYKHKTQIAISLFISLIAISCNNDIEKIEFYTQAYILPAFVISDLETTISDSGIVKIQIYAPDLIRYDKAIPPYDEYPNGINVDFFDSDGEVISTLKCKYAKYLIDDEIWHAKNNVEVVNTEKNERLNTEHLIWDINKKRIYSEKFVRIKTADELIIGNNGFESNQDFTKWKILTPTGSKNIKDEEF